MMDGRPRLASDGGKVRFPPRGVCVAKRGPRGLSHAPRIQVVLEDQAPVSLTAHLDRLKVSEIMRREPKKYVFVCRRDAAVVVETLDGPPTSKGI